MNNRRISDLLYKYTINALNDDERRELDAWVAARPDRQSYLQMLSSPQSLQDDYRRRKSIDVQKAIREMEARIGKTEKASRSSGSRFPFFRIAAVLVLLLVGGTFWYHREQTRVTPPEISEEVQLAMEQSRFFDLRRWGIASQTLNAFFETEKDVVYNGQTYAQYYKDAHFTPGKNEYFPLPYIQLYYVPGLYTQNKGYN